ncbi:MAG: RNA polymerase sigma factor [bacterium]|nr:RNA polymerase sigma factor [bacterium]
MENAAFEKAVLEHKDRVHAYARMMLKNAAEAQDVAQEALVRLWTHRAKVDVEGSRAWLLRTTHNLCIDRIRKRKVRAEVADPDDALRAHADSGPGPAQLSAAGDLGRSIEKALKKLSEQDRAVVLMREVQQMPYDEIADVLGLPMGTLKARLHRARERLRQALIRSGVTP